MTTTKHIAIIYNPNSTGDSEGKAKRLKTYLAENLAESSVTLMPTKHAGHAEELAFTHAKRHKKSLIISASGDGGYHEVVNGAMRAAADGAQPVCAVLPAGNANDHRSDIAELPLRKSIVEGNVKTIDLLEIEIRRGRKTTKRYGHSYLGLGLTPTVAIELNRHSLSALREAWIVVRSFYKFRPFKIKVGDELLMLDSLIISNIGRMAKVLSFERSDLDDGKFEVIIFPHGHKLRLLAKLIRAALSTLKPDHRATEYRFEVLVKTPIQIDGEITELRAGDSVTVRSRPKALSTLL